MNTPSIPDQLDRTARALMRETRRDRQQAVLKANCVWLLSQLRADARVGGSLHRLWGICRNVDEVTGTTIVEPSVLKILHVLSGASFVGALPNAGVQHTYGYLLSLIDTPYGRKRDRWIDGTIVRGFGIPADCLTANPSHGTLLANATWLLGSIAFRNENPTQRLRRLKRFVAPELAAFEIDGFSGHRIEETVPFQARNGRRGTLTIRTDLVLMPRRLAAPAPSHLLVYSLVDSRIQRSQLITAFPMQGSAVNDLLNQPTGITEVNLRYNAALKPVRDLETRGRRIITVIDQN